MEIGWLNEQDLMALLKEYLDLGVFAVLGLMSFLMLAYSIERFVFYARVDLSHFADHHGLQVALTNHLTALASIASNAPFIGLLGTVLGILITFHDLAQGAELSAANIMLGLALALKATAAGLLVAIPATLFYNALLRRAEVLRARWHSLRSGT
jgi:biopolymer transport protein ExbB